MSKNQLAQINTNELVGYFTPNELDVVINSYAKGATHDELALFIQICTHNGLSPFKNHIYFIKYGNTMNIQVSVEGILHLAQQREDFKGVTSQLVHENDEFEIELDESTQEIKITKHTIKIPRGKVAAAYGIARREGYPDKVVLIEKDEVEHLINKQGSLWKTYYNDMFKKFALKRALKLQFGIEVDEDQSSQVSFDSYDKPNQRVDITPNTVEIGEGEVIDPNEELKNRWVDIRSKQDKYRLSEDELKDIIKVNFNKVAKELTLQQLVGLSKLLDLEGTKKKPVKQEEITFDDIDLKDF